MISWDNMEHMAKATGSVSGGNVQMTANEVGGQGRTAQINGTVSPSSGWFTVNITAPNLNCQGIEIRSFPPHPRSEQTGAAAGLPRPRFINAATDQASKDF